jgi:hypothetical protein
MNAAASGRVPSPARLSAGARVGGATITAAVRVTAIAEVYQADSASGPVTLHVVHPELARQSVVRDSVKAAIKRAQEVGDHPHLVRTIGGGVEGDILFVITEALDGNSVKDLLARKRGAGFGARGAGNLVVGAAAGLVEGGVHGGLSTDSIIVARTGKVKVCDLALGAGVAAAVAAGLVPSSSYVAPEIGKGAPPSVEADVFALGALLYEALVGKPLERGGPRPSEAVAGLTSQVDELIARTCAANPDKRFGSVEVVKEVVADALARGGATDEAANPGASSPGISRPSLSQSIANPSVSGRMQASSPEMAVAADPALAAALADTHEHWLVAKGRLDYGPFSLADIVAQIKKGDIVAGNVIIDKDTGGRCDVHDHPLLGPIVDAAKQSHDDARRAHAEDHHQSKEKKRGALLFVMIGLGAAIAVLVIILIVKFTGKEKASGEVSGVDKVGSAALSVTFSQPKKPAAVKRTGGGGSHKGGGGSRGGGGDNGDEEALAFDMSDDEDGGSEKLDMGTIYGVYSRYGGQLARCMSSAGTNYALIKIAIDGPSGKVTFVRVNDKKTGGLAECVGRVMRSMKFPPVDGTRTRAEFDISL